MTDDPEKQLGHIAEVSRNARATWFGLIGALLFCGVTLLDVQDRDFFEYGSATKLPLIGVEVPVVGFFVTAPLLVLALYAYLHIYLMKLWRSLAAMPDAIPGEGRAEEGTPLDDAVYPWLLADAAIMLKTGVRRDFGWLTGFVSWALGWAFAPVILGWFWWRSMPYHHEGLTLWIGALFAFSLFVWLRSALRRRDWLLRDGVQAHGGEWEDFLHWLLPGLAVAVPLMILALSWLKTEGVSWVPRDHRQFGLVRADLYRAEIAQRPPGWVGRGAAWDAYRRKHWDSVARDLKDGQIEPAWVPRYRWTGDEPPAKDDPATIRATLEREFKAARGQATALLEKEDWRGVDLRRADLREAFLTGLDLRAARLDGADLIRAQLEGADLSGAQMDGANLSRAQMDGANLSWAQMNGAYLIQAQMNGANFRWAQMDGATLSRAQMDGATLSRAQMDGAYLGGVQMDGANLIQAQMDGANLSGAQMDGAVLRLAQMNGAYLSEAQMNGANLIQVQMESADLSGAQMDGATLSRAQMDGAQLTGANITDGRLQSPSVISGNMRQLRGLTQAMLDESFGDVATQIPDAAIRQEPDGEWRAGRTIQDRLTRPAHWPRAAIPEEQWKPRYRAWLMQKHGWSEEDARLFAPD